MAFGLVMFATFVAQGAEPHPEGGSALAADPPGRLRGGFDLGVTVGMATAANGCNGNGGNDCFLLTPMFVGELGYQADRHFAVRLRAELGLAGVFNSGGGFLMLEATPTRVFSLAVARPPDVRASKPYPASNPTVACS